MKKLTLAMLSTMMVLATAPTIALAPAQAAANSNVALCKDLIATDPGFSSVSVGQCVSYFTVADNYFGKDTGNRHAVAMKFCKLFAVVDPIGFDSLYASQDECVDDIEGSI